MCKLMVGVASTSQGQKNMRDVMCLYRGAIENEEDGLALGWQTPQGFERLRTLADYPLVFARLASLDSPFVVLHGRTRTYGAADESNIHLFNNAHWVMAHNGSVVGELYDLGRSEGVTSAEKHDCEGCLTAKAGVCKRHKRQMAVMPYYGSFTTGKSDTLEFLEQLPRKLTIKTLKEHVERLRLYGLAIIVSLDGKTRYLINNKKSYVHIGNGFTLFYSFKPSAYAIYHETKTAFGVPYSVKVSRPIDGEVHEINNGVFKLVSV